MEAIESKMRKFGGRYRDRSRDELIGRIALIGMIALFIGGLFLILVHEAPSRPKVGVLNVDDSIYGFKYAQIIDKARKDSSIKAVVLRVDSPGGSVTATFEAENAVARLSEEKPVVSNIESLGASGAYVVASASDYIYAHNYSLTGGLAVIAVWTSYEDYYENKGIDFFVYKSGKEKDLFASWRKPTDVENHEINALVQTLSQELFYRIKKNRPGTVDTLDRLKEGSTFYGHDALGLDLVDNIGFHGDAVRKAAKMAELGKKFRTVYLENYF